MKQGARTACYNVGEAVLICWDTNEERNEPSSTSAQRLLPSKWNPKGKHSVRDDASYLSFQFVSMILYNTIVHESESDVKKE